MANGRRRRFDISGESWGQLPRKDKSRKKQKPVAMNIARLPTGIPWGYMCVGLFENYRDGGARSG